MVDVLAASIELKLNVPKLRSATLDFMRVFASSARTRRKLSVLAAHRFGPLDQEFMILISRADNERDLGKWSSGEFNYYSALIFYPTNAGYIVQYGHCLKEQEKYLDAEVAYRTAWSLGQTAPEIAEHIDFVARKRGANCDKRALEAIRLYWDGSMSSHRLLDAPPTRIDIETAFDAVLGMQDVPLSRISTYMNGVATNADVVEKLLRSRDFPAANRDLITVVVETNGHQK